MDEYQSNGAILTAPPEPTPEPTKPKKKRVQPKTITKLNKNFPGVREAVMKAIDESPQPFSTHSLRGTSLPDGREITWSTIRGLVQEFRDEGLLVAGPRGMSKASSAPLHSSPTQPEAVEAPDTAEPASPLFVASIYPDRVEIGLSDFLSIVEALRG